VSFSPFYRILEEKGKKLRIIGNTMAQWINHLQFNSFVNRYLTGPNSLVTHVAKLDFMPHLASTFCDKCGKVG